MQCIFVPQKRHSKRGGERPPLTLATGTWLSPSWVGCHHFVSAPSPLRPGSAGTAQAAGARGSMVSPPAAAQLLAFSQPHSVTVSHLASPDPERWFDESGGAGPSGSTGSGSSAAGYTVGISYSVQQVHSPCTSWLLCTISQIKQSRGMLTQKQTAGSKTAAKPNSECSVRLQLNPHLLLQLAIQRDLKLTSICIAVRSGKRKHTG